MMRTRYLKESLKLSEDIFQKAYMEFMRALADHMGYDRTLTGENQKDSPIIEEENITSGRSDNKQDQVSEEFEDSSPDQEFKKEEKNTNLKQLFKKIAREVHPDKLARSSEFERKYKTSLFEKARNALQEDDYYAIVQVAEELDIEPPAPTKEQIEIMKSTNSSLEGKIRDIENSYVWSWFHGDDKKKKSLMESWIEHLDKECAGS